ncbi:MAG: HAD hydrolase-like protein [Clostridia bacterium]|nr:HAD hydrolase-like protein [Clostridia bacterium]
MKNNKIRYALFDLDGTLTNSEGGIARCITTALNSIGIEDVSDERIKEMIGPPFRVSMKIFYDMEGEVVDKMLSVYRDQYDIDGWSDNVVYDGIMDLLKKLHEAGIILAVATSKPRRFTEKIVKHFGFSPYFSFVGAATDDGVLDRKSAVIESVLKNLNIENRDEVIMIGDRKYDIIGAKETQVASMGILWGFGDREELAEAGADYIMETTQDVANFFLGND